MDEKEMNLQENEEPQVDPKFILKRPTNMQLGLLSLGLFLLVLIPSGLILGTSKKVPVPTPTISVIPTNTPTSTSSPTPTIKPAIKKHVTISPSPTPTPKTNALTSTPTQPSSNASPGRNPSPPQVEILFPSDGQDIKYSVNNNSRNICVGYVPRGGDVTSVKMKYNINNTGWNAYQDLASVCFDAKDGSNTIQMRFINAYNEESDILTRNFIFENN